MKNAVLVNALNISEYAFKELPGGSPIENVIKKAWEFPDVSDVFVISVTGITVNGTFSSVKTEVSGMKELFEIFLKYAAPDSYSNIFYIYGDTPLIDPGITGRMYSNHIKYFASYTFAEGYPYGLAPEIIKTGILAPLIRLAGKQHVPVSRGGVFEVIKRDINFFDIETEISGTDQRMLRVSLSADTKRNFNQMKRIIDEGGVDEKTITGILSSKPELLRGEPAFVNVQISERCPQSCSYCPYPRFKATPVDKGRFMSVEEWKIILRKVKEYSDDAVFSISLWGEPSLHPDITELVKELLSFDKFSLVIETSGLGWKRETVDALKVMDDGRISWILSLDGENRESYRELRGEGYEEALEAANYLSAEFKDNFYLQSVRMKRNEAYLEKFFRKWKEKNVRTIIQKYDNFCGFLPDEKVTDVSPVKRYPCWHIKRDLTILIDGTVQLCRDDIRNEHSLGNIYKEDLPEIWERGMPVYLNHIDGEYPEICRKCDEYYTYNF